VRIEASPDAVSFILDRGGQLFVRRTRHGSFCCSLTVLVASTDPPEDGMSFQRFDAGEFLVFLHPAIMRLPELLQIDLRGRLHPHVEAYWEGLAYVV
jgi:hypothetical protein